MFKSVLALKSGFSSL